MRTTTLASLTAWLVAAAMGGMVRAEPVEVAVTILPEAFVVDRIGGSHVRTATLVAAGQSPHTFEPTIRQITRIAEADVYFSIGLPFEDSLLAKIRRMNPAIMVVELSEGIRPAPTTQKADDHDEADHHEEHDEGHHEHEEEGEEDHHDHGSIDPHIWMNPRYMERMAAKVEATLSGIDPSHREEYRKNHQTLKVELETLDRKIAKALKPFAGGKMFVFHAAFGHFAEAYGLEQVTVEVGGKEPTAKQLTGLIDLAGRENIRTIFVQPQFSRKSAEAVARAIGAELVVLDPLAYEYVKNLDQTAKEVRRAMQRQAGKETEGQ
ncbi:MAG: zinc ABC transporter solute-binding protein [Phycisphaerae bacterium]|nr:zinc ABC transporter solute-binding protein [Phycisphaerae bacterium]